MVQDALTVEVKYKDIKKEVNIFGGSDHIANYQDLNLDGVILKLAYGQKPIELPFSLYLNEFILERYPGLMSPSSYASEVTLIDKTNNLKEEHRIFMNNVLDYKGYRFSSHLMIWMRRVQFYLSIMIFGEHGLLMEGIYF